ncbi:MAG: dTDP-4-dehydrorhamnose reductase [Chloroflexi bacterium RBG_16_54_18]|nr:MAG: dTDP-4-dehydrorhamnose reductase [Chloroflexi bacterium RBG_16_54_18]
MKRIVLLGSGGQLGWELERALAPLGLLYAFDFPQIDLMRVDSYYDLILEIKPFVIINAAAFTAVDQAESEPETAFAINGRAPGILAELAQRLGAALVHYSTDYVFDGTKTSPYLESDLPNPLNVYGESKLLGEQSITQVNPCHLILRTSWVYSTRRDSFVRKVIEMSRKQDDLHIVTDQIGSPTWARMLAETTAQVLAMSKAGSDPFDWLYERAGLYHLAGSGFASRYEWAQEILNLSYRWNNQREITLKSATTDQFPSPARRPLFSALDCQKFENTFALLFPPWKNALKLAVGNEFSRQVELPE